MKQSEKLDLILKTLYEREDRMGEIHEILRQHDVEVSGTDAVLMCRKLANEGLIDFIETIGGEKNNGGYLTLTGNGIAYVEEDSYHHKGHPIITNNYTISNSRNTSFVSNSSHVTIQQNIGGIEHKINEIADKINLDSTISSKEKEELLSCLQEVSEGIKDNRAPKWAFSSLMNMSANVASVGQLVIQLGQLSGLL